MDEFRRFFFRGLAALVPTLLTIAIVVWAYHFVNENVGAYITSGLRSLCMSISETPAPGMLDEELDALLYGQPLDEWRPDGRRITVEYKIIHHSILQQNPGFPEDGWEAARDDARRARSEALWRLAFAKYRLHWLGFLIAIVVVYFTGFFLASLIGRSVWRGVEGILYRVPLIRAIYPNVKQVTDFLLSDRKTFESSGVVAVQYPSEGIWSLGLSTGAGLAGIPHAAGESERSGMAGARDFMESAAGQGHVGPDAKRPERTKVDRTELDRTGLDGTDSDLVTIFIPSSPTPVTGYVIQVPRTEVIRLDISLDEALRFTVSGGVIKPGAVLGQASSDEDESPAD